MHSIILFLLCLVYLCYSQNLKCPPSVTSMDLIASLSLLQNKGYKWERIRMRSNRVDNTFPNYGSEFWAAVQKENGINYYKMGGQSALLLDGCTPPEAQYFSFGTYLYTKNGVKSFGNMGNGINHLNTSVQHRDSKSSTKFDARVTYISSADENTIKDILDTMSASNVKKEEVNIDKINANGIKMGSDSLYTFLRAGFPKNIALNSQYFNNIWQEFYMNVFLIYRADTEQQPSKQVPIDDRLDSVCRWGSSLTQTQDQTEFNTTYTRLNTVTKDYLTKTVGLTLVHTSPIFPTVYDADKCNQNGKYCRGVSADALFFESMASNCSITGGYIPSCGYTFGEYDGYLIQGVNHADVNVKAATYNMETVYDSNKNIISNKNNQELHESAFGWGYFNPDDQDSLWSQIDRYTTIYYTRPGMCVPALQDKKIPCVEISSNQIPYGNRIHFVVRTYLNPCTKTHQNVNQVQPIIIDKYDVESVYSYHQTWTIIMWVIIGLCIACLVPFLVYVILDCCCEDDNPYPAYR